MHSASSDFVTPSVIRPITSRSRSVITSLAGDSFVMLMPTPTVDVNVPFHSMAATVATSSGFSVPCVRLNVNFTESGR